jgi:hypothetical protein
MHVSTFLVSPIAEWLADGSDELHSAIGYTEPDFDASGFAVKNLGFIRVLVIGENLVEVTLHPRNAESAAVASVSSRLRDTRAVLYRLRYLTTHWQSEVFSNAQQLINRMLLLCSPAVVMPRDKRYSVEPLDYMSLFMDPTNRLRPLLQKWRASFNQFDNTLIPFAAKQGLLPRTMIISVKQGSADPTFRYIGEDFVFFGEDFAFEAIGNSIKNQPDKSYGEWVADFYKTVAQSGLPRYDFVDAVIQRSDREPRTRYERLMLPWKTASDEVLVTLCSAVESHNPVVESSAPTDNSVLRKSPRSV